MCPYCQIQYDDFRTGENFQSIVDIMWSSSEDPTEWRHKRRHSVLGFWRELKLKLWREHLEMCEEASNEN